MDVLSDMWGSLLYLMQDCRRLFYHASADQHSPYNPGP
jgi:hypothetical protein